ncbi:hypothetical protein BJP44_05240 [Candidatus Williamhamiltonella defendens]|nr:hypothetical protein [Candidatus Hamiltonella defensa]ATW22493.1 hypothetical protein BJP44_05240 [Candidatus Hamiltonella defensa]
MFKIRTLKNFASEINLFTYNSGAKNKQNPTNFSDFTKLINSISSTNTVHCKKKEVAELEKKDIIYMPFPANEDMFLQILSINVPRVLSGPPPPCIKHIIKIFDKKRTKKIYRIQEERIGFWRKILPTTKE